MAGDIFLKLDGIDGESVDAKHTKEIDIDSWSWGMTQTGSTHIGGGSGTAKVSVQDLSFTKRIDKSSPNLAKYCSDGKHIKKGVLIQRKAGGNSPVEFLKIELEDIIVSSYQTGSSGEIPTDSFSLNFAKYKFVYAEQKADGSKGPETEVAWHIAKNEAA
jgi:type VI secretion system secreted protein Hcp